MAYPKKAFFKSKGIFCFFTFRTFFLFFFICSLKAQTFAQRETQTSKGIKKFSGDNNDGSPSDLYGIGKSFIENIGQYGNEFEKYPAMGKIKFAYEGLGMPVLFTKKGLIHLQRISTGLTGEEMERAERKQRHAVKEPENAMFLNRTITAEWLNANPDPEIIAEDLQQGYHTYGKLNGKARAFKRIIYRQLYPGIDLIYTFPKNKTGGFEYSLMVKPGADISAVKMKYGGEVKSITKMQDGSLLIKSDIEGITETLPLSYYAAKNGEFLTAPKKISSIFLINNKEIGFVFPDGYDKSESIIVDPFVTGTGNLAGLNSGKAKDVDFDYAGNVYVTGGGDLSVQRLAKFNANGVLQWTFAGTLAVPTWTAGPYYGGWVVEKTTGSIYIGQGFNFATGFIVIRLNTAGIYDNYNSVGNPAFREDWKMIWSCNNGSPQIFIAGGGTNSNNNLGVLSPPSTSVTASNTLGIPAITDQDMSDMVIDPVTNSMYTTYATVTIPSLNNAIYKHNAPYASANIAWNVQSGFAVMSEANNRPYLSAGLIDNSTNILALNSSYLFYWDGKNLKAFDKITGAGVGTSLTVAANASLAQGGIVADACNNIFVGAPGGIIKVYKFTGTAFDDAAAPDITIGGVATGAVYDLAFNESQKLIYASGDGFVASVDVSSYNCSNAAFTLTSATDCVNLTATVTLSPAPPGTAIVTYGLYNLGILLTTNFTGIFTGLSPNILYTATATINQACSGYQASTTFTIIAPNLSFVKTDATCGNNSGAITVSASGGAAPLQYSNNGGISFQPTGNFNGLAAGLYAIVVKDANGCRNTAAVNIINSNGPAVSATETDATCGLNNGTITANASGGSGSPFQYSLNGGVFQASNLFNSLAPGSYTVTVKDAGSCSNSTGITVASIGGTAVSIVTTTSTCGNANGTITANVTGGTPPYQYSINGTTFFVNNVFTGLAPGSYNVTVKDINNCINTVPASVLNIPGPVITAAVSPTSCNISTGVITITASNSAPPLLYSANNGTSFQTSNIFTGLAAGNFIIVVLDANGCRSTTTVTVSISVPQVTGITTPAACNVSNGLISALGTGGVPPYKFSLNGGAFQVGNIFSGLAAGNYTLGILDNNGCTSSVFPITVGNTAGLTVSAVSAPSACITNNGSIVANGNGGTAPLQFSINAGPFGASNSFSGLAPGSYTITVKDASGCTSITTAIVNSIPKPIVTAVATPTSCGGSSGTITATGAGGTAPYQYSINGGTTYQASNVFNGLSPGTYTVVIKDNNGCTGTTTLTVINTGGGGAPTIISLTITTAECGQSNGRIVVSASPNPLEYGLDGVNYQNSATFNGLPPATYTVFVRSRTGSGCLSTAIAVVPNFAGPQVTATNVTFSACGGNTGTITVVGSGGTSPYRFSVDAGVTFTGNIAGGVPFVFTGLSAAFYTVIVRDNANVCRNSILVYVGNANGPSFTANTTGATCALNSGIITVTNVTGGTPPYTYSIDGINFQSGNIFNGLAPGPYAITVRDAAACVNISSVTIGNVPVPTVTAVATPDACNSSNGKITLTGMGGITPYEYSINGTTFQLLNVFTGLGAGNYTLTLRDGSGCLSVTNVTVSGVSGPGLTASAVPASCNLSNGSVIITGTGGVMPYQYSLNGGPFQVSFLFTGLGPATYTATIKDSNNCINTSSVAVGISFPDTSLSGVTGGSQVCATDIVQGGGTSYHDAQCNLIAKVLPSGATPVSGNIKVCTIIDGSVQIINAEPYVQRHYDIEPDVNPANATAVITLYFKDSEFENFNAVRVGFPALPTVAGGGNADPNKSNLRVTQYHGLPIAPHNAGNPSPGFYSGNGGGGLLIIPAAVNYNAVKKYWEVSFPVNGFSGFYVHTNLFFPLAITLNYFKGIKDGDKNLLEWKLNCAPANATIILERSSDAINFRPVFSIATDSVLCRQLYNYTDNNPIAGINYYRLRLISPEGKSSYSNIVALNNGAGEIYEIAGIVPNPVTRAEFKLILNSAISAEIELSVSDISGRTILTQKAKLVKGFNSIQVNPAKLAAGSYQIFLTDGRNRSGTIRFVKL